MGISVTIRQAEEKDIPHILELYRQPDMDNGETLSEEKAKAIFQRMMCYPNYKIYVAEMDSEILGTYALAVMDNLAHMGVPSGLIEDVVVKSQWQGKGIGRQMINDAIDRCRKNGCYKAALSSNLKRVKAHTFYENLGFQKHGYSFLIDIE
jgi:GNAT superfamily N-acetyltransferase